MLTQFKIPYNSHFTMYLTLYGVAIISKIKKIKIVELFIIASFIQYHIVTYLLIFLHYDII